MYLFRNIELNFPASATFGPFEWRAIIFQLQSLLNFLDQNVRETRNAK